MNHNIKNYLLSLLVSLSFPFTYTLGSIVARLIFDLKEFGGMIGGVVAGYAVILIYKRIHLISSLIIPIIISVYTVSLRQDLFITYVLAMINYTIVIKYHCNKSKSPILDNNK